MGSTQSTWGSIHISTEHTNKKLTNNMSDFAPTETTLPSGVDAQAEDNQISEDKITKQDLDQIDESNIVSGERANKGGVENYAKARQGRRGRRGPSWHLRP